MNQGLTLKRHTVHGDNEIHALAISSVAARGEARPNALRLRPSLAPPGAVVLRGLRLLRVASAEGAARAAHQGALLADGAHAGFGVDLRERFLHPAVAYLLS